MELNSQRGACFAWKRGVGTIFLPSTGVLEQGIRFGAVFIGFLRLLSTNSLSSSLYCHWACWPCSDVNPGVPPWVHLPHSGPGQGDPGDCLRE